MSEAKLLVVWKSREIVVDDFGRNFFQRIGIPLRLPASVNEYGPNSLVEVRVLAKSSHQSEKENQYLNISIEKWFLIKNRENSSKCYETCI
jgi:hypothetical protein